MMDISELIIQVKNTQDSVNEIKKVTNALKETGHTATTVGKGLFAAWSFTKVIQGAKLLGDAFKDVLVTFRNFDLLYGKMNKEANASVQLLTSSFQETERSAKKLLSMIGSRTIEFNFDTKTFTKVNTEIAKASEEIGAFFQIDPKEVADKLTRGLNGMTKSLAQYGIIVDTTSDSFKQEVEQIKLLTGESEEAAKALAILNRMTPQFKKFEGSAKNQQQTLSFAIENITNTLKSGPFAKAGEILSKTFVPILNKINEILQKPWVSEIAGIALALGGVLIAFKSITVALKSLQLILATFKIASFGGSALSSIGPAITGIFSKLITSISTALTGAVAAVSAVIAGWPVALTAAVVGVLVLAGTMILSKLTTGSWIDIGGMTRSVLIWFSKLGSKIKNAFATGKFASNTEIANETIKTFKTTVESYQSAFNKINEEFYDFKNIMKKEEISDVSETEKRALDKLVEEYEKNLDNYNKTQETINRLVDKANEQAKTLSKMKAGKDYDDLYQSYQSTLNEQVNFAQQSEKLAKEGSILSTKVQQAYQNLLIKNKEIKLQREQEAKLALEQAKFINSTKMRWIDFSISLKEMVGKISKEDKIKAIKDKIKLVDEALQFSGLDVKEKINFEMQKAELLKNITQVQIESLNKEYDIIQKTNDMIMEYAKEAIKFKETGTGAIKVGTMEDYKYTTRRLMETSGISSMLGTTERDSIKLDQQRNRYLKDMYDSLKKLSGESASLGYDMNIVYPL